MEFSYHINKLKQKIALLLGVNDYVFFIIRETPNSSTFKLSIKDKSFYIKTFKTIKSFHNESLFSKSIVEKYNVVPRIIYTGKHDSKIFPYYLIRESSNYISLDHVLKISGNITESMCFQIGNKLSIFNSLSNKLTGFKHNSIFSLIKSEYKYYKEFCNNNTSYFNFAFKLSNDVKAKNMICSKHKTFSDFINTIDAYLENFINNIHYYNTDINSGLVHGDLWCQNILYNKMEDKIRFIDFNNTHIGDINMDFVRFKLRGTSVKPYYSIDELHIDENLWSSFLKGYFQTQQHTTYSFNIENESIIILLLLIRTVNHYLNYSWLKYLDNESSKEIHYSKLLKIILVLFDFLSKNKG